MKNKNKRKLQYKLSKKLLPDERRQYETFGEPDMSQNWLELFTPTVISDLFTIKGYNSDNQEKADYIERELADYGFEVRGEGTNILTMSNPVYPGVVFKIALDDCGIADNFNDDILQHYIPRYNKVLARHNSAIVSVQERVPVIKDSTRMGMFKADILKLLRELSHDYLVADLSPSRHLNYGIGRDGKFVIIDGSDLFPLGRIPGGVRCKQIIGQHKKTGEIKRCGGRLHYTNDFMYLVCEDCGKSFLPLEFRPEKELNKMRTVLSDGLSSDERKALEREELEAICAKQGIKLNYTDDEAEHPTAPEQRLIMVDMAQDDPDDTPDDTVERVGMTARVPVNNGGDDNYDQEDEEEDFVPEVSREVRGGVIPAEDRPSVGDEAVLVPRGDETDQNMDEESDTGPVRRYPVYQNMINDLRANAKQHPVVFSQFILDALRVAKEEGLLPPELQFDVSNKDISDEPVQHEPGESYITYRVINGFNEDSSLPGIYLEVHGGVEEAYEKSGLPIYVTIPDIEPGTQNLVVSTSSMGKILVPAIKDLIEDALDIQSESARQSSDEPEEGDPDDSDQ